MIGIIDYGMGNLHSVKNALDALGFANEFVSDPKQLDKYEKLNKEQKEAFKENVIKNIEKDRG